MTSLAHLLLFLGFLWTGLVTACPWEAGNLIRWSQEFATSGGDTAWAIVTQPTLVDVPSIDLKYIDVQSGGRLIFQNTDVRVRTRWIHVSEAAEFILGAEDCRYTSNALFQFVGHGEVNDDLGDFFGTKGLGVKEGGLLEIHGVSPRMTWTRLSQTAQSGDAVLFLRDPVDWKTGDEIVIASTDYDSSQSEQQKVLWVAADGRTVHLMEPLAYMHWGEGYERAEVGLLTRNIRFEGDMDGLGDSEFGGHLITSGTARIQAAEFTRMGQQGLLARYPVHIHMMGVVSGDDVYIKDCAMHNNFQRCLVIHGTQGAVAENNVAYRSRGHCYFLEDGAETDNVLRRNLGILPMPGSDGTLLPSDDRPSVFWITNLANDFIDNAAVGGTFGFWFALPEHPTGLSEPLWSDSDWMWPRQLPAGTYLRNVLHSSEDTGFFIDEGPRPDHTTEGTTAYTPRAAPYNTAWRPDYISPVFEGHIMYKNRNRDVWTRTTGAVFRNCVFLDSPVGVQTIGEYNLIEECLFIGETDNIGHIEPGTWFNDDPGGRSRPKHYNVNFRVVGFEIYDAGGPALLRNCEFRNFYHDEIRPAGGIGILPNARNMINTLNKFEALEFGDSNRVHYSHFAEFGTEKIQDSLRGVMTQDVDGSVTGEIGGWLVNSEVPFVIHGRPGCEYQESWNAYLCPPSFEGWTQLEVRNLATGETDFGGTVDQEHRVTFWRWGLGDQPELGKMDALGSPPYGEPYLYFMNNVPNQGYLVTFPHPTPPKLRVRIGGTRRGEYMYVALRYPAGTTFSIGWGWSEVPMEEVSSFSELAWDTFFFDSAANLLYLKLEDRDPTQESVRADWGFTTPNGEAYVHIQATCNGDVCAPTAPLVVPPAHQDPVDGYEAVLTLCQGAQGSYSGQKARGLFRYNPEQKILSWTVFHNLQGRVIGGEILDKDQNVLLEFPESSFASPILGETLLAHPLHVLLYRGDLSIRLQTRQHPQGEVAGRIGCASGVPSFRPDYSGDPVCSKPVPLPSTDPCDPGVEAVDIFRDGHPNWADWSWGRENGFEVEQTDAVRLCGGKAARLTLPHDAAWGLHFDGPGGQQSLAGMEFMQFYIRRVEYGPPAMIQVAARLHGGQWLPPVDVEARHTATGAIVDEWTRVRVPIAELGVSASGAGITDVRIGGPWYHTATQELYVDEWRFIGGGPDPVEEVNVQQGSFAPWTGCSDPAEPPRPTQPPPPTPPPIDPPTCSDGIKNGDEYDVDCGGDHCKDCAHLNLIPNPGFDSGEVGPSWFKNSNGLTVTLQQDVTHRGSHAVRVSGRNQEWHGMEVDLLPILEAPENDIHPGDTLYFEAWCRTTAPGQSCRLQSRYVLEGQDPAWMGGHATALSPEAQDTWHRVFWSWEYPQGTRIEELNMYISSVQSDDIYVDSGFFTAQRLPPTCSDGRQNGDELGMDCGGSCGVVCRAPEEPAFFIPHVWSILERFAGPHLDHNLAPGGLDLHSAEAAWWNLVSAPSMQQDEMPLVTPGSRASSYLWHKVSGTHTSQGSGTGFSMPPHLGLQDWGLETIGVWIDQGAVWSADEPAAPAPPPKPTPTKPNSIQTEVIQVFIPLTSRLSDAKFTAFRDFLVDIPELGLSQERSFVSGLRSKPTEGYWELIFSITEDYLAELEMSTLSSASFPVSAQSLADTLVEMVDTEMTAPGSTPLAALEEAGLVRISAHGDSRTSPGEPVTFYLCPDGAYRQGCGGSGGHGEDEGSGSGWMVYVVVAGSFLLLVLGGVWAWKRHRARAGGKDFTVSQQATSQIQMDAY